MVDEALKHCPGVKTCIVYRRTKSPIEMVEGRDVWWHEQMENASDECPAEPLDAEHPLYLLYTSGTTGKPKGILHTTGGYAVGVYATTKWVFDIKDEDVYWCTADIGWVTGHSYIVYGPLQNGATTLMYEGAPTWPQPDRFWKIVERHKVKSFTPRPPPSAHSCVWERNGRASTKCESPASRQRGRTHQPRSLDVVPRPHRAITAARLSIPGGRPRPGMIMISPYARRDAYQTGFGDTASAWGTGGRGHADGESVPPGAGGYLVIKHPWPSMLRTIYGDDSAYRAAVLVADSGIYFTGDGARRDEDGYFWVMGRIDDVINVSGHRLSTMEVESALVAHEKVAEAAVVARPDEIKGQGIVAFVTLQAGNKASDELKEELRKWVAKEIGSLAKPDEIRFTDALPKTRSGKIMRRLLREIASGARDQGRYHHAGRSFGIGKTSRR